MATIVELMKDRVPGSVKVSHRSWEHDEGYFIPYFKDNDGYWYGLYNCGSLGKFDENSFHGSDGWDYFDTESARKAK